LEEINYFAPAGPSLGGESGRIFGIDSRERTGGIAPEWVNTAPYLGSASNPLLWCTDDFRLSERRKAFAQIDEGISERLDPTLLAPVVRNPFIRPTFSY